MIDIKNFRENPKFFENAAKQKKVRIDIQAIIGLDEKSRELAKIISEKRSELKSRSKQKPSPEDILQLKILGNDIQSLEKQYHETSLSLENHLLTIPNPPSPDTPEGIDERSNKIIHEVGERPKFHFTPKPHWELGVKLDVIDIERATKVSGSRFVFLKRELVMLQFALLQHALSILTDTSALKKIIKKCKLTVPATPFIPIIPPVIALPRTMHNMARLEPKDERYYIPSDDQYLIGSAEHTLGAMHMDEILPEGELPLRYIGYSTSFRREAGSYGKDTRGIIRVHQFDKLEMESFTIPEMSRDEQDFFVAIQQHLMQSLHIPYRVVLVCTGDMGGPDYRQIDIETWFPGLNQFKETHSSDLTTDFQSRRLKTRVRRNNGIVELVHTNDATAFAMGRTLAAIMENNQKEDGSILVPKVLQKYAGIKIIKR